MVWIQVTKFDLCHPIRGPAENEDPQRTAIGRSQNSPRSPDLIEITISCERSVCSIFARFETGLIPGQSLPKVSPIFPGASRPLADLHCLTEEGHVDALVGFGSKWRIHDDCINDARVPPGQ